MKKITLFRFYYVILFYQNNFCLMTSFLKIVNRNFPLEYTWEKDKSYFEELIKKQKIDELLSALQRVGKFYDRDQSAINEFKFKKKIRAQEKATGVKLTQKLTPEEKVLHTEKLNKEMGKLHGELSEEIFKKNGNIKPINKKINEIREKLNLLNPKGSTHSLFDYVNNKKQFTDEEINFYKTLYMKPKYDKYLDNIVDLWQSLSSKKNLQEEKKLLEYCENEKNQLLVARENSLFKSKIVLGQLACPWLAYSQQLKPNNFFFDSLKKKLVWL